MDFIISIIFVLFVLNIIGKILKHLFKPDTVAFWLIAVGLMCIPNWGWTGLLLVAWRYIIIPIGRYQEKHGDNSSGISNSTLLWLIPLFWPFLILKLFFTGKVEKTDTSYSDYLEHKKHNGR